MAAEKIKVVSKENDRKTEHMNIDGLSEMVKTLNICK